MRERVGGVAAWLVGLGLALAMLTGGTAPALALALEARGMARAAAAQPPGGDAVKAAAFAQRVSAPPGDRFAIAVELTIEGELHIWPSAPKLPAELADFEPIPTAIKVDGAAALPSGVRVVPERAQWAKPDTISVRFTGEPLEIESYKGNTTVFVPVVIGGDAKPGPVEVRLSIDYQACDDTTCFPPGTAVATVTFDVAPEGAAVVVANEEKFGALSAATLAGADEAPTAGAGTRGPENASAGAHMRDFGAFGVSINIDTRGGWGLALILLVGIAGGVILNLTPCVLPVLPIKVLGLQNAAGSRGRLLWLGAMTFAGVIAFWLALGGLIAAGKVTAISEISSYWQFTLAVGIFILFMAIGMFDKFQVGLPSWVYAMEPDHSSTKGAFAFGILTAVLATPCVAPLAGSAAAWATTQPAWKILLVFGAIGLGMGLPYFILAINPAWVRWLPRAGPASSLLKQVLGLLMIAVAVFFIGTGLISLAATYPWIARQIHWWVIAVVVVLASAWLVYRTFGITKSGARRAVFTTLALACAAAGVWWAAGQTAQAKDDHELRALWREYDQDEVASAVRQGKTVVLEFTAEWCLICKTLERTVLSTEPVIRALQGENVVSFKIDLTSRTASGWEELARQKEAGIPLLVIQGPGLEQPWKRNAYGPGEVIETIEKAKK